MAGHATTNFPDGRGGGLQQRQGAFDGVTRIPGRGGTYGNRLWRAGGFGDSESLHDGVIRAEAVGQR